MRTIILIALMLGAGYWAVANTMHNGALERFLDAHPSAVRNAAVEYYWGVALRYTHHNSSAIYRFRRVIEKYPDTAHAPLAWVDVIDIIDERNDRTGVFREAAQFIAAYPDHSKAEYVKKKVYFLQNGI
jgi:TolA-binding protein